MTLTLLNERWTVEHLLPPIYTRYPFNSWVDWDNVSKVSCSRKQQQHQSVLSGDRTCNLSISRLMPLPLGYVASHNTHTRARTYTCTHTHTTLHTETTCTHHTHNTTHTTPHTQQYTHTHTHTHV